MPITPQASTFLRKITCQQHSILPEQFLFLFCSQGILFADLSVEKSLSNRRKQDCFSETTHLHRGKRFVPVQHNTFFTLFQLRHADCEVASCGPGGLRRLWEPEKQVQLCVQKTVFTFLSHLFSLLWVRVRKPPNSKPTQHTNQKKPSRNRTGEKFLFANRDTSYKLHASLSLVVFRLLQRIHLRYSFT